MWYQLWDPEERNVWIDLFEFLMGFVVIWVGAGGSSWAAATQVMQQQSAQNTSISYTTRDTAKMLTAAAT